ncbi:MAG: hypothetical protein OFPII_28200 [Osedax symbiont Rs1]|nr:MAG: hypothetical protein OFPII_28200 [Osedax symbiont Rs1]
MKILLLSLLVNLLISNTVMAQSEFLEMCSAPTVSQQNSLERLQNGSHINGDMDFAYTEENFCLFMDSKLADVQAITNSLQGISDLSPHAFFTNLVYLDLAHNEIADLSPLQHLTKLRVLKIAANPLSDISILSELQYLEVLTLGGTDVNDLSPLINNQHLKELYVQGLNLLDCSAKNLKELKQGISCN